MSNTPNTLSPELKAQIEKEAEEWRDVVGYEGIYKVSNLGRVKSLDKYVNHPQGIRFSPGTFLVKQLNRKYHVVSLSKEKKSTRKGIHILVAQAFIPNPDNKPQVNHKDLDKFNNRASNLEWVTGSENMNHYWASVEYKPTPKRVSHAEKLVQLAKSNGRKVRCDSDGLTFNTIKDAADYYGIDQVVFSGMIRGERQNTTGKFFHFIDGYKNSQLNKVKRGEIVYEELFKSIISLCDETNYPRGALQTIKRYCEAALIIPLQNKNTIQKQINNAAPQNNSQ